MEDKEYWQSKIKEAQDLSTMLEKELSNGLISFRDTRGAHIFGYCSTVSVNYDTEDDDFQIVVCINFRRYQMSLGWFRANLKHL